MKELKKITDFEAIIFDMDGVLIDSEKIWHATEMAYLEKFITIKDYDALHRDIVGRSIFGIYDFLVEEFTEEMKKISRETFLKEYEIFGLEQIYNQTSLLPGVLEVLRFLKSQKIPLALASSSPQVWIDAVLKRHNLNSFFPVIVSGDSVSKGKPDPEIFLKAAERIKIDSKNLLVFEDSKNGVIAGKSAGMTVYGYRNGFNDEQDLSKADEEFDDFLMFLK